LSCGSNAALPYPFAASFSISSQQFNRHDALRPLAQAAPLSDSTVARAAVADSHALLLPIREQ
jgi:hypothetical protein